MPSIFPQFSEIKALVSEKQDGSMSLSDTSKNGKLKNIENRKRYFTKVGLNRKRIITARLVHGNHIAFVDRYSPDAIPETDGLITTDLSVVLAVTGADCYPVYLYDVKKKMIGLVHVGWLGAVKYAASETIHAMQERGSNPYDIAVAIGPGICQKHYSIPEERVPLFKDYPEAFLQKDHQTFLDIKKIIRCQLEESGVTNIIDSEECTYCLPEKYFSYRRDKPEIIEAQIASITLL
jgi:YfiH family protein